MRLLLSLDYELFFGRDSGTIDACLIEPTEALLQTADALGLKVSLFVDAGYLLALRKQAASHPRLTGDFSRVASQLENASRRGHDVQLHIHPHWEDTRFDGVGWRFDTSRYRLHDFEPAERGSIVQRYKSVLEEICDAPIFAYRAGGWCLQPFEEIGPALKAAGVWLDSTVFPGGYNQDRDRGFDFRTVSSDQCWRFSDDPLNADPQGYFLEVPISAVTTGPLLYWRMAMSRLVRHPDDRTFGNGSPMEHDRKYYFSRLLQRTTGPASIDGIKAAYVKRLLRGRPDDRFVNIMGHPKSLSRRSLQRLGSAVEAAGGVEAMTYRSFADQAPA